MIKIIYLRFETFTFEFVVFRKKKRILEKLLGIAFPFDIKSDLKNKIKFKNLKQTFIYFCQIA